MKYAGIRVSVKEIEENNRMGTTRDLFKKIRDTKGIFHAKMDSIKDRMGIPYHLIYLLRNLYAGQEATVRTGHGITDWFQMGKGVHQGCVLSPCLFNLYAESIMRNAGLESRLPGEISITSDMQMTPPLGRK